MPSGLIRTLHFARAWTGDRIPVEAEEISLGTGDPAHHATRFRRADVESGPGWVLLHGMTRTGRNHLSLVRFARALAASGGTVLVPEVPDWVALRLAPHRTVGAVEAGVAALEADARVTGRPGLMGFSFGGPQALRASMDPALAGRLACVSSFGGYGALERTVGFLLTGVHEWEGARHRVKPDPYGRWIVAANYLPHVPGYEGTEPVAEALREVAAWAGDHAVESWDPAVDGVKDAQAAALPRDLRTLFRFFAPPAAEDPPTPSPETDRWARALAEAGVAADPLLALPHQLEIPVPVHLVHGRNDHLIPFSEALRLARRIRAPELSVTVTGLFAHSAGDPRPRGPLGWGRETWRLGGALSRLLGGV